VKSFPNSVIIPADEGTGIWQPGIKGNCITVKVSPWNHTTTQHTVFLHELPKGGEVGEHAHNNGIEIFVCLSGEGILTIDGKDNPFKMHDVAYIDMNSLHRIKAISNEPLKYMVILTPTGLEERLKLMGKTKSDKNELPPENFDSEIGKQSSHGVV